MAPRSKTKVPLSFIILHTTTPRVCMAFGDFGRHGTNPNPLRTFALTKHSPLIGRDASQPGQWANFDYYHQKSPKGVDNPSGHAPHRGPPNGPFGPTLFSPPKLVDNPGGGGSIYIYTYTHRVEYNIPQPLHTRCLVLQGELGQRTLFKG